MGHGGGQQEQRKTEEECVYIGISSVLQGSTGLMGLRPERQAGPDGLLCHSGKELGLDPLVREPLED